MQDKAEILKQLSANVSDFFTPLPIPIIDYPNDIKFLRDCVAGYQPCILRGYIDHWPALKLWNDEYLINKTEDLISINVTPHGHADSILVNEASGESVFVYPAEIPMHMREFLTELSSMDPSSAVLYLSQQDDNLRRQLPSLLDDIKGFHDLPEIAFGLSSPEAINLWIGDEKSISSCHKDHFENLYAVISGQKTFTLLPPVDSPFLHETQVPTYKYHVINEETKNLILKSDLALIPCSSNDQQSISWIPLDPALEVDLVKYPNFALAHPIHVTIQPGEVLYIPSMWFHRVSQTCKTISVNYWFDQVFNFRYVFTQLVRDISDSKDSSKVK